MPSAVVGITEIDVLQDSSRSNSAECRSRRYMGGVTMVCVASFTALSLSSEGKILWLGDATC
jgi:hypothetical protein